MRPAMPSARSRWLASAASPSRIRSPALSRTTRSAGLAQPGVTYCARLAAATTSSAPFGSIDQAGWPPAGSGPNRRPQASSADSAPPENTTL